MLTSTNDQALKDKAIKLAWDSKLALEAALICCTTIEDLSLEAETRNEIKRILDEEK